MLLLDGVTNNTTGDRKLIYGPCTIFVEGGLDGGTVTIKASRGSNTTQIDVATTTSATTIENAIRGPHYLSADLTGTTQSSSASCTVAAHGWGH